MRRYCSTDYEQATASNQNRIVSDMKKHMFRSNTRSMKINNWQLSATVADAGDSTDDACSLNTHEMKRKLKQMPRTEQFVRFKKQCNENVINRNDTRCDNHLSSGLESTGSATSVCWYSATYSCLSIDFGMGRISVFNSCSILCSENLRPVQYNTLLLATVSHRSV